MLNPEDLTVESFATTEPSISDPIGGCCTGCVSGCGINPTAGGCQSASGDAMCPPDPILAAY
jgi:hypothetical protein